MTEDEELAIPAGITELTNEEILELDRLSTVFSEEVKYAVQ